MKVYTMRYVHTQDVLPDAVENLMNESDLPWTFGDCHLSLIRRESLLSWVEEQHEDGDVSDEDMEECRKVLRDESLNDVLIALQ